MSMLSSIAVHSKVAEYSESPVSKAESSTTATTPANEPDEDIAGTTGDKTPLNINAKEEPVSSKGGKRKSTSIPYTQVIHDAIVALKDRTGSSSPAIQKWIINNHPSMDPTKLKQKMNFTLKLGVKSKRFIKIKSSFKINPVWLKTEKKKRSAANARKRKATAVANAKVLASAAKAATVKKLASKAEIAAQKEKERKEKVEKEKQKKERERQDRIKKRKFPMEDLKLIEEDKELRVVSPYKDCPRPVLQLAMPNFPAGCRSDTMGVGVMDEIIHIYHFFRGDVGWARFPKQKSLVAPFSLQQWMECVQYVSNGWCKRARMLPPLMTHLFVVTLQHLVPEKLSTALTPASWSEVLLLYMDAMEQKYTERIKTEEGKNTIRSLGIDAEYLFHLSDEPKGVSELDDPVSGSSYLGSGTLKKAHSKCVNSDPWHLNTEELLSLLKALVDDVLGNCGDCAEELEVRNEESYELLKRKKIADAQFRKIQTARNRQLAAEVAAKKEKEKNDEAAPISDAKSEIKGDQNKTERTTRSSGNDKIVTISEVKLEKARREQLKAQDAYAKGCRSKRIRTEPVGMDRSFQQIYHSFHDPELIFFLQRGKPIQSHLSFGVPESETHRRITWQIIKKKSVLNNFMESLDIRGIRESNSYDALQLARRHVYDDIKEMNDKKILLKGKSDVKRRLENARTNYQNGRKSGRLASQSEQELIDLQEEIERLEKSIADANIETKYDMEFETGLNMLRNFETKEQQNQRRRANRRGVQNIVDNGENVMQKLPCSRLWPSGHIDGTGIIGLIVSQLMDLEERVEKLATWEKGDRKSWVSSLETALHGWNEGCTPFLICEEGLLAGKRRSSINSNDSKTKKGILDSASATSISTSSQTSTLSPYQIVCMIRQRLLQLESRVFESTGLSMVAKETDEADENMSTSPVDEEEQLRNAWKKPIHRLKRVPAKAYTKIHTAIVEAIASARKAQNTVVVAQLKHALVEYHPEAASYCKDEALEVLERNGGYEDDFDDESDSETNETDVEKRKEKIVAKEKNDSDISSCLCAEAIILNSSLDGQEDASRVDWIRAVKQTRTVSKLAALVAAFVSKASAKVGKMEEEHAALLDALNVWGKSRPKRKKSIQAAPELSEVWANVNFSDEFCFAKIDEYPLWPARKCVPKDDKLASELESVERVLVSLVGERGALRVVKKEACVPFSSTFPDNEDLSSHSRDIRSQLDEAMSVARRVVRGHQKKQAKTANHPIHRV